MTSIASVSALVLAAVLATSAIGKLRDRQSVSDDFAAMGLPRPEALTLFVSLLELFVAAALLVAPRLGAMAAVAMLGIFTVFLVRIVRSGVVVRCGCFGARHRNAVSSVEIARNGGLVLLAILALGVTSIVAPTLPSVMFVSSLLAVGMLGLQLLALRRDVGSVLSVQLAGELREDGST